MPRTIRLACPKRSRVAAANVLSSLRWLSGRSLEIATSTSSFRFDIACGVICAATPHSKTIKRATSRCAHAHSPPPIRVAVSTVSVTVASTVALRSNCCSQSSGPVLHPQPSISATGARMFFPKVRSVKTGQGAVRTTFSATLPITNRLRPVRPCVAITTMSAL